MYEHDEERNAKFQSYLWWSTVLPVLTVLGGLSLLGYGMSFVLQRPWYEGVMIGSLCGAFFISMQASNEAYKEYWIQQAREDFEKEEQCLAEAWRKEQERPEDEYIGF